MFSERVLEFGKRASPSVSINMEWAVQPFIVTVFWKRQIQYLTLNTQQPKQRSKTKSVFK